MRPKISEYRDRFEGRTAAVLGGGPSLAEDMRALGILGDHGGKNHREGSPLLIAVNYHAFLFCEPDFMVYNDHPGSDPKLLKAVEGLGEKGKGRRGKRTLRVSPDPTSDIQFDVPVWTGFYSSNTATWFALWCGCDPVILCGMDCYQGEMKYPHEYQDKPHFHYGLDFHIRPWIEEGRNLLPHVERVKVMSGPLINVFKKFEPQSHGEHREDERGGEGIRE